MLKSALKPLNNAITTLFSAQELTADHVRLAYRLLLGREVETAERIEEKLSLKTLDALRAEILCSSEFVNLIRHQPEFAALPPSARPGEALTPDQVVLAYQLILGRVPESEQVIQEKMSLGSLEAIRAELLASPEYLALQPSKPDVSPASLNHVPWPPAAPVPALPALPHLLGEPLKGQRLLLLGTCQLEPLVEAAGRAGLSVSHMLMQSHRHAEVPSIKAGAYDAIVVALTLRHVLDAAVEGWPGVCGDTALVRVFGDRSQADRLLERAEEHLAAKLEQLSAAAAGLPTLFMSFLEPSFNYPGASLDRFEPTSPRQIIRRLNERFHALLKERSQFHFIDINEIADQVGRMHLQDDVIWVSSHASFIGEFDYGHDFKRLVPPKNVLETYQAALFKPLFGDALCIAILDHLKILRGEGRVKLVIVDLDDTLWRGVAAEENGFEPGQQTEGWPLGFIEALLFFKKRGGLLAICSKNEEAPTLERLGKIWHNRIGVDDFVSIKINWERKSQNIAAILAETNLLPESTVFIDDNPREIEEVRSQFPHLRCLTGDHMDWRRTILKAPELQVALITNESADRTLLVKARVEREAQAKAVPRAEFLLSLAIEQRFILVRRPQDAGFDRGFELLNKTNQFNTTGRRWSLADMEAFFASGGMFLITSLRDKTIDNGIIGAALIKGGEIVQAVLSCRVFGLGAETALGNIATRIALLQAPTVIGRIVNTGKNFTCHEFFTSLGFTPREDHFEADAIGGLPDWISITHRELEALFATCRTDHRVAA